MSNLAQFVGGNGPVTSIVNFYSGGGTSYTSSAVTASSVNNCKETLSGALTATTLKAIHSISGRGRVNILTAYAKDATARTIRLQVVIDGTTVFDATTNGLSATGSGLIAIGSIDTTSAQVFQPIDFYTSLVVNVASSLSETDKVATGINYETWA